MGLTKLGLSQVKIICDSLRSLNRMATSTEITEICMSHPEFPIHFTCKDPDARIRTLLQRESKEAKQGFRGKLEIFIYDKMVELWGLRDVADLCLDQGVAVANRCDGHIYVNTNPAWPLYAKLGKSEDSSERLKSYQTYSPFRDWVCVYYAYVKNRHYVERRLKSEILPDYRNNYFVDGKSIISEEWFQHTFPAMQEIMAFVEENKNVVENE